MTKYICTIESNSSHPRTYEVETRSAMKCADQYGRCEGGEVVTVTNKSGRVLSRAAWTPEDGGHYYRVFVPEGETI
ncbi:MAG: hypothetical protein II629_05565 [Ruminococcus sp.]|nr:hypothetical protein [Ruminococcus sp.]